MLKIILFFFINFYLSNFSFSNINKFSFKTRECEEKIWEKIQELGALKKKENELLTSEKYRNVFCYLLKQKRSFLGLKTLFSVNSRQYVHFSLLLKNLVPKFEKDLKDLNWYLEKIKKNQEDIKKILAEIKKTSKAKEGLLAEVRKLLEIKNAKRQIIENSNFHKHPFLKRGVYENEEEMVLSAIRFLSSYPKKPQTFTPFKMNFPVVGELVQKCHGAICPYSFENNLTISLKSYSEFQVYAPIEGRVVYVGFLPKKGYVVILRHSHFFLALIGLGAVFCQEGDTIIKAEPLGRMPNYEFPILFFKLYSPSGEQLDPFVYLNVNIKDVFS